MESKDSNEAKKKLEDEVIEAEKKFEELMTVEVERGPGALVSDQINADLPSRAQEKRAINTDPLSLLKYAIRSVQEGVVGAFIDYGPPYAGPDEDVPLYGLNTECCNFNVKVFAVHNLLNMRANPNDRDPDDLYYSAAHWCVRNCHFLVLRMLRRAGANFNLQNEFGQSVLSLCSLLPQPAEKAKTQLKMIKYLVKEGADVNHRDRGGNLCIY